MAIWPHIAMPIVAKQMTTTQTQVQLLLRELWTYDVDIEVKHWQSRNQGKQGLICLSRLVSENINGKTVLYPKLNITMLRHAFCIVLYNKTQKNKKRSCRSQLVGKTKKKVFNVKLHPNCLLASNSRQHEWYIMGCGRWREESKNT